MHSTAVLSDQHGDEGRHMPAASPVDPDWHLAEDALASAKLAGGERTEYAQVIIPATTTTTTTTAASTTTSTDPGRPKQVQNEGPALAAAATGTDADIDALTDANARARSSVTTTSSPPSSGSSSSSSVSRVIDYAHVAVPSLLPTETHHQDTVDNDDDDDGTHDRAFGHRRSRSSSVEDDDDEFHASTSSLSTNGAMTFVTCASSPSGLSPVSSLQISPASSTPASPSSVPASMLPDPYSLAPDLPSSGCISAPTASHLSHSPSSSTPRLSDVPSSSSSPYPHSSSSLPHAFSLSHLSQSNDPYQTLNPSSSTSSAPPCPSNGAEPEPEVDYDWATFVAAYARGRWDPAKTPAPPRATPRVSDPPATSGPGSSASATHSAASAQVLSLSLASASRKPPAPKMQRQPSSSVSSIASEEGPADGLRERELHAAVAGVGNAGDRTATRSTPALTLSNATPDMGGMLPALESAVAAQQRSLAEDPISALGMDSLSLAAGPSASASVASVSTPGAVGKPLGRSSSVSAVTRTGAIKRGPGKLKLPSFRMNYSLDPLAKAMGSPGQTGSPRDGYHAHTGHPQGYYGHGKEGPPTSADTMTSAAAIRWAAARISVAPLVLPSPEHELTDPMRGVTTSIPGAHPTGPKTPGEQRLSSIPSFWVGTTDVEDGNWVDQRRLETIEDNSPISVGAERSRTAGSAVKAKEGPSETTKSVPPPATAPLPRMPVDEDASPDDDYFGPSPRRGPSTRPEPASDPASPTAVRTELSGPSSAGSAPPLRPLAPARHDSEPAPDATVASVPAVPRRVALTRQTSSPLPSLETVPAVVIPGITPVVGAGGAGGRDGSRRAVREKQMFEALGYLVPPNAPDELERRRALFKFNIWNTSPDPNFDRIVHLAKLVFNTKMVGISLVDGSEEWFKSKAGLPVSSWNRSESLCAHAILRRGEEPMVVLDTTKDWRFANNPMVKEGPEIRFYAGAPLRTQDGYNIGCLSVFDDMPRGEFSPRQRHALREFAAIAMRELELWRDKIQLRVRDRIQTSMEQFTRECLEIDNAADAEDKQTFFIGTSMDKVYAHAAKLVKRTLDVQGAIVLDVAHSDVLETVNAEGSVGVVLHNAESGDGAKTVHLSPEEYGTLQEFFTKYPQGRVSEGIVPLCLRGFLPTHIQYALTVPILNVDKRPFALLCAYIATEQNRRYLEGHELSYLRAIGVIILSAVLKRRMILADRSKGLFISNISHELRTPLHGILAAAELLSDSPLNQSQLSFLSTIQACGTSLVETVNHVLDFTKLSGNTKAGGVENVIPPSRVNLMQLVEEAVEGCWIGYRARIDSEIGSVYAPPKDQAGSSGYEAPETVVDIDDRDAGWTVKCEKGGIRRVLMNLFGNSLKFTSRGYVHVTLRELPPEPRDPPTKVRMELGVMDTGKGISQNFMKNQLFHPFSQENPLQTGTGLGLAIVNSIVQSKTLDGTIDVSSVEGVGTEIRVTFAAELVEDDDDKSTSSVPLSPVEPFNFEGLPGPPRVSLIGFDRSHRGVELLRQVTCKYLSSWGFNIDSDDQGNGDIVIVNDSIQPIVLAIERKDTTRSYIILCSSRGDTSLMGTIDMYERIGGFARLVFKPGGPSRLRSAIKLCIHAQKMIARSRDSPGLVPSASAPAFKLLADEGNTSYLPRRYSEETWAERPNRPPLGPRAVTVHPPLSDLKESWLDDDTATPKPTEPSMPPSPEPRIRSASFGDEGSPTPGRDVPHSINGHDPASPTTVPIAGGGTLLKSAIGAAHVANSVRVLVVEDNSILRSLLVKWLKTKGYEFREGVDGSDGVRVFESEGPFDVVLVDLSMPVLDGIGATAAIRELERKNADRHAARILALTGMSSLEDKRRAFEAGVDGYLVKPVGFKTLDEVFTKLGINGHHART